GDDCGRLCSDCRGQEKNRQGLYDDGDRPLHQGIFIRVESCTNRPVGQDTVCERIPYPRYEHAGLGRILERLSADAKRYPCDFSLVEDQQYHSLNGSVSWFWPFVGRFGEPIWISICS